MKLFKLFILFLFCPTLLFSQKSIHQEDVRNVIIPQNDSTIKVGILVKSKEYKVKNDFEYFWYKSNEIYKNRGGFDGNLLHNTYQVYNTKGELTRSGEFKKGLRSGEWKIWYKNGELKSVSKWHNGRLCGKSSYFSQNGQITKSINHKNDILHKKTIVYDSKGEIKEINFYKNGLLKLIFIDKIYIWHMKRKNNMIIFKPMPVKKEKKPKKVKDEEVDNVDNDN